jgi:hypothetical protein
VVRERGDGDATETRSVENVAKAIDEVANTAGSRDNDGAGAASELSIEQLFSQPACLRSGHIPEALQQHDARVEEAIMAIDGSMSAARTNAARSRCTITIVDSYHLHSLKCVFRIAGQPEENVWTRFERLTPTNCS